MVCAEAVFVRREEKRIRKVGRDIGRSCFIGVLSVKAMVPAAAETVSQVLFSRQAHSADSLGEEEGRPASVQVFVFRNHHAMHVTKSMQTALPSSRHVSQHRAARREGGLRRGSRIKCPLPLKEKKGRRR